MADKKFARKNFAELSEEDKATYVAELEALVDTQQSKIESLEQDVEELSASVTSKEGATANPTVTLTIGKAKKTYEVRKGTFSSKESRMLTKEELAKNLELCKEIAEMEGQVTLKEITQ